MRIEAPRLKIAGKTLSLTNLDKVLYPKPGFTKKDVIDYYVRIAPVLIPHLKDRALTLKRYPDGVEGFFFYERHCPEFRPAWLNTKRVVSRGKKDNIDYCVINDVASLIWTVNLADLELHTSLSRKDPKTPTVVAFDLDPGAPSDVIDCANVAILLKAAFDKLGLESFVKTSGSKGLQVYVPLNTPVDYERTKNFAHAFALYLEEMHPKDIVSRMAKALRKGKVLIDWSQNQEHKSTVCAYSLRAKERPTVSTPLKWEEVKAALKSGKSSDLVFETEDVLKRVKKWGDLFAPVLKLKQKLPESALPS